MRSRHHRACARGFWDLDQDGTQENLTFKGFSCVHLSGFMFFYVDLILFYFRPHFLCFLRFCEGLSQMFYPLMVEKKLGLEVVNIDEDLSSRNVGI